MKTVLLALIAMPVGAAIIPVAQLPAPLLVSTVIVALGALLVSVSVMALGPRPVQEPTFDQVDTQPLPVLELHARWFLKDEPRA